MLPDEEELLENLEKWKAERPDQAAKLEQWVKTVKEVDPDYEPHLDTSYLPYDREDLHKKALNIREQKKLAKAKALQGLPMDEASRLARAKEKYKGVLSNEDIQNLVTDYVDKLSDDDILNIHKVGGSSYFSPRSNYSETHKHLQGELENIIGELNGNNTFRGEQALKKASVPRLQKILEEQTKKQLEELNKKLTTPNSDTLEKRLQRAKDIGFDTSQTYYHGTSSLTDFNEFDKPKNAGIYFSSDPQYVDKWAIHEPEPNQSININEKPRTLPVFLRVKNTFDYNNSDHLQKLLETVIKQDPWVFEEALLEKIPNPEERNDFLSSLFHNPAKYEEFIKNNPTLYSKALDRAADQIDVPNNYAGTRQIADVIKKAGFDSYISYDDDDLNKITKNIAVFDPKNIRSKFANFDPAMAESADISSFVPKTKGEKAIGAAIKGLGVLDKGLAYANKLAIGADIAQGNIPEAAISAAQFVAPKLGAAATRVAPFLDLLRPELTQTQEQEETELEQAKFNKLKQALKKRGLAVE